MTSKFLFSHSLSDQHEATLALHPERSRRVKVTIQNKITLIN